MNEFTKRMIDEVNERIEKEKQDAGEKDLSQFDFRLQLSKLSLKIILFGGAFFGYLLLRQIFRLFLYSSMGISYRSNSTHAFLAVILFLGLISALVVIVFKTKSLPEVKCSYMYYKKKEYHYSEISSIDISAINIARIHLLDGKSFWITRDFENYDTFLCWAEKCGIPVDRTKEVQPGVNNDVDAKTAVAVITAILVVVAIILAFTLRSI